MAQGSPQEREVKLAVRDLELVEARLRTLPRGGAVYEGVERETNVLLDSPDRALVHRLERLRLRTVEGETGARVTWKGPGSAARGVKQREEQEYRADDADTCATVFLRLGFAPVGTYRKERATWHWEGLSIMLDRLDFGTFVEVEIKQHMTAEEGDQLLSECLAHLGLRDATHVEASYAVMQEEWDERQGHG